MDRNNRTKIYCFFAVSVIAALFGAVCLFFGLYMEFDGALGYFAKGSVFAPVLYTVMLIGAAGGIAAWVMFRKKCAPDKSTMGCALSNTVTSALCAAAIFAYTVRDFIVSHSDASIQSQAVHYFPHSDASILPQAVHYILWVMGILGALGMAVCALRGRDNEPVHSLAGFFAPLFLASKVLVLYFDRGVAVNNPIKLIFQLSLLSFMLAAVAETGISLGRGNLLPRWLFTLCISVAIGGSTGIGTLIALCAGLAVPGVEIWDAALLCIFALWAGAKLFFASRISLTDRVSAASGEKIAEDVQTADGE